MRLLTGLVITGAIVFAAARPAAAVPILINGGFETGDLTGWTTGGSGLIAVCSMANPFCGAPYEGTYSTAFNAADTTPDGTLSQTFATTSGAAYDLSFAWGALNGAVQQVRAQVLGSGTLLDQTVSSTNISEDWTVFVFSFIADGASATLLFSDLATNPTISTDGKLDAVSVTEAAAVPEPASLLLFGSGLAGLAARVRRRRFASADQ